MKSNLYFKNTGSRRLVPIAYDVWTGDMVRTRSKMNRQLATGMPIHVQVRQQINNVHVCKADHYFDVVY